MIDHDVVRGDQICSANRRVIEDDGTLEETRNPEGDARSRCIETHARQGWSRVVPELQRARELAVDLRGSQGDIVDQKPVCAAVVAPYDPGRVYVDRSDHQAW